MARTLGDCDSDALWIHNFTKRFLFLEPSGSQWMNCSLASRRNHRKCLKYSWQHVLHVNLRWEPQKYIFIYRFRAPWWDFMMMPFALFLIYLTPGQFYVHIFDKIAANSDLLKVVMRDKGYCKRFVHWKMAFLTFSCSSSYVSFGIRSAKIIPCQSFSYI